MEHPFYEMLLNLGFNHQRVYSKLQCLKSDNFSDFVSALTAEDRKREHQLLTTPVPERLVSEEHEKQSASQVLVKEAASCLYISSDNESQRVPARKKIRTDEIIVIDSD